MGVSVQDAICTPGRDIILVVYEGDMECDLFDEAARDGCHEPYIYWRDTVTALGFRVEQAEAQSLDQVAGIVFLEGSVARSSTGLPALKAALRGRGVGSRRNWLSAARRRRIPTVLIITESSVVRPENADAHLLRRFPKVLTYNDEMVDGRQLMKFVIPMYGGTQVPLGTAFAARRLLTAIAANKTASHPSELYSARVRSFAYFAERDGLTFDLYGAGWRRPPEVPSTPVQAAAVGSAYRGLVSNKLETLCRYRFAIAYENSRRPLGYVTEKVFDCLRAGCVPIYLGPENAFEYVDAKAVIDRRQFESEEALGDHLVSMSDSQWGETRNAGRAYLASERYSRFLPPAFASAVNGALGFPTGNPHQPAGADC